MTMDFLQGYSRNIWPSHLLFSDFYSLSHIVKASRLVHISIKLLFDPVIAFVALLAHTANTPTSLDMSQNTVLESDGVPHPQIKSS